MLTSVADVKAWAKIQTSNDDTLLTRLVESCSAWAQQYTGRDLQQASYTEVKDGSGGHLLTLRQGPLISVQSLTVGQTTIPPSSGPTVPGYYFDASGALDASWIRLRGCYEFCRGRGNVVVAYTAGWAATPFDLAQAVIEMVVWRYREVDRVGVASMGLATQPTSYLRTALDAGVKNVLDAYRKEC